MTTYKDAGVDIDAQDQAIDKIKAYVKETSNPGVLSKVGNFGGLFDINSLNLKNPVLVSSADGVGTKVKLASLTGKYHTIGQDLVNHCINDILVQGASPLFFMDYIASSKLEPDKIAEAVRGLTIACKENGMALLGGEMAEMPGVYSEGHYDLAGFIVGVVEKDKLIDGSTIKPGDIVLGFPSNGLMTNGFSLAIKVFEDNKLLKEKADELLKIHPCYNNTIQPYLDKNLIKGMAHITGGGLIDNIPRILPNGCGVQINLDSWNPLSIFKEIQKLGEVPKNDMYRTFNMGIGFVVITDPKNAKEFKEAKIIGQVVDGTKVELC